MKKDFEDYLNNLKSADNSDVEKASNQDIERTIADVEMKIGKLSAASEPHAASSAQAAPEPPVKNIADKRKKKPLWQGSLAAAAIFVLLIGSAFALNINLPVNEGNSGSAGTGAVDSYSEIFECVNVYVDRNRGNVLEDLFRSYVETQTGEMVESVESKNSASSSMESGSVADSDSVASGSDEGSAELKDAEDDYSHTNAQTEGIDEGDIVKTDGKNIYILRNNDLIINSAKGADSSKLSETELYNIDSDVKSEEMYVFDDILVVVASNYGDEYRYNDGGEDSNITTEKYDKDGNKQLLLFYDISNPDKPQRVKSMGQDGTLLASRLKGDKLYVITQYYVGDKIKKSEPKTYVPCIYDNAGSKAMFAEDISIEGEFDGEYLVVCSYDTDDIKEVSSIAYIGSGSDVYMSTDNIYIAGYNYLDGTKETESDGKSGQDSENKKAADDNLVLKDGSSYSGAGTDIIKISQKDGILKTEAKGSIPGRLLNQFSMDEYKDNLRVVTTLDGQQSPSVKYSESETTASQTGMLAGMQTNALFVLDKNLKKIGSIEGLAEDERVYSVRFDGSTGYFVTFRETDPLFAVDLSDAKSPKVLDALKIPGFSQYLHVYSKGRLLGIGMEADEKSGSPETMKLSMFNTENPADVTEQNKLVLDITDSEVLENHKALFVSKENNIIAFPGDGSYDIYGYSDEEGFYRRTRIETDSWYDQTRGLYVGKAIYICGDSEMFVLDMESLEQLAGVEYY